LELSNGKLGLIDYGQTRRLTDAERINLCQIVSQLGKTSIDVASLADAMRQFGFKTRNNKDEVLARYAALFFDNDVEAKRMGCATPQLYLLKLAEMDPLENVPDAAGKLFISV
jgi:aarF domain-containing kinase